MATEEGGGLEKELSIYVSASAEMDAECELLGQLLATMPETIRWVIRRTPSIHKAANPDLKKLAQSHFYVILLGMDITAPVGVELNAAKAAHLVSFAYRCTKNPSSPAAAVFARNADVDWHLYKSPQEFIDHFERALVTQLLEGSPGYGLGLQELEALAERLERLEGEEGREEAEDEERRGAGHGGVILASR